ncbi:hypothetical protein [Nocardia mexicana]|uniref:hypothetical protein n=1 Tax=Nocardia mexicana TaxID=279262 RepID=UPI0011C04976|nr:hypothetical protein [Nocardia mexicana]
MPTNDGSGLCQCPCSCLAFGTLVQEGGGSFKAIETYEVGDEVMAAGKSLDFKSQRVVFSAGSTGASREKNAVVVVYGDTAIVTTGDHLFLMHPDRTLKRADRLTTSDSLVAATGEGVAIKGVHVGDYLSGFHHVAATSREEPDENLDGHLLNTNGVVSADYNVQIRARSGDTVAFDAAANTALPIVGSPEYVAANGEAALRAPALEAEFAGNVNFTMQPFDAPFDPAVVPAAPGTFIPAEATRVTVPPVACSFLPPDFAEAKKASPKRAFNDPFSREATEQLLVFHKAFYGDINYTIDWASDEVNAFAWVENGVRRVDLKGGLIRDNDLDVEGIAVVIAHEIAHHHGGPPVGGSGLSCEGQADYRGVRDVMRKVWFGQAYGSTTDAGIAQMAAFFGVPDSPTAPGGSAGCAHPAGACRVATYHAAVTLSGKPSCSG